MDINCWWWHKWEVMICRELKNSSDETMQRITTDDLKTWGKTHNNTNHKKAGKQQKAQAVDVDHRLLITLWALCLRLELQAAQCSSMPSFPEECWGPWIMFTLFSLPAQSDEANTDLTTCEENLPLCCFPSLFKPVPIICEADVWPSII